MSTRVLSPNDSICYLTPAQREHLKKSTRKLAKVLGTTPMLRVVDAQRRSDLVGAPEPGIQAPQMESTVKITCNIDTALQGAPRLRFLATEPCQDSGMRAVSSPQTLLMRSPLSASLITPSSTTSRRASFFPATPVSAYGEPRTPRTSGLTAHERRLQRKRLSKLSRTLGQAVPPVLVTPARRRASRQYSGRRRRRSLHVIINSPTPDFPQSASSGVQTSDTLHDLVEEEASSAASFAPLPTVWQALPAQGEDEGEIKMHHIAEEDAELSMPSLSNEDEPRRSSRARARPVSMTLKSPVTPHLQRSHSEEPGARVPDSDDSRGGLTAAERTRLQEELPSRSGSRIAQIFYRKLNAQDSPEHERYERAVAHRRERRQGWSGEWNAASVQEVIVKLRDL